MADILNTVTDAVSGGVVGILGSALGRGFGLIERKLARVDRAQEIAFEQAKWAHETSLLKLQAEQAKVEAEHEAEVAETAGAWAAFTESQRREEGPGGYPWVDAVRSLTRPVLTFTLAVALVLALPGLDSPDQKARLLDALSFAASAAILWWFGDRAPSSRRSDRHKM